MEDGIVWYISKGGEPMGKGSDMAGCSGSHRVRTALVLMAGLVVMALLSGCEAMLPTASLYDLKTGKTIEAKFQGLVTSGGGEITATGPDGELFKGRYSTMAENMSTQQAFMKLVDRVAFEEGYGTVFGDQGKINGVATLAGDKGTVVDMMYTYDKATGHGNGEGTDNKGNEYRVMF
jgi:hypothetical protein